MIKAHPLSEEAPFLLAKLPSRTRSLWSVWEPDRFSSCFLPFSWDRRGTLGCPTWFSLVCPDRSTAEWLASASMPPTSNSRPPISCAWSRLPKRPASIAPCPPTTSARGDQPRASRALLGPGSEPPFRRPHFLHARLALSSGHLDPSVKPYRSHSIY